MSLHLPVFNFILFDHDHLKNRDFFFSRVRDILLTEIFLYFQVRVLSSENNVNLKNFELLAKSFMKVRIKRGLVMSLRGLNSQ